MEINADILFLNVIVKPKLNFSFSVNYTFAMEFFAVIDKSSVFTFDKFFIGKRSV